MRDPGLAVTAYAISGYAVDRLLVVGLSCRCFLGKSFDRGVGRIDRVVLSVGGERPLADVGRMANDVVVQIGAEGLKQGAQLSWHIEPAHIGNSGGISDNLGSHPDILAVSDRQVRMKFPQQTQQDAFGILLPYRPFLGFPISLDSIGRILRMPAILSHLAICVRR